MKNNITSFACYYFSGSLTVLSLAQKESILKRPFQEAEALFPFQIFGSRWTDGAGGSRQA